MLESYEIENIEQLRAISDMLRVRIIDLLLRQPMTVTQIGEELGEAPAKIHYHVRELEKAGLLRLVETREKGGILEKYYQPIAREFTVEKSLLSAPPDEALGATSNFLNQIKDGFQRALRWAIQQKESKPGIGLGVAHLYMTLQEQEQLGKQIFELLKPYEVRRGIEGERELVSAILVYPQLSPMSILDTTPAESKLEVTWTVGTAVFSRADLVKAVVQGKHLRIKVVGVCQFADDVTADLVDQAVDYFHLVGKLIAPAGVREVLMKKVEAAGTR
ncbi:MAG TPA: helix-turn-helix domain-containing protein [Ktedonobacteraceae bacterium]|jgi:DNA-binding transcriptional ArsR family regulator|nr:helix-turn-helix domain-containing protein [Ktedonobacteraceae bacterium]